MAPDAGTTVALTQLVGLRRAMQILLTNPTLTGAQACDLGVVTEVVPDGGLAARVDELAAELAASAPLALAATKRLMWSRSCPARSRSCPARSRSCPARPTRARASPP